MQLDTETLARLRDELLQRGARTSLVPQPIGNIAPSAVVFTPEVAAVMQRVAPMCELLYLLMVADQDSNERERDLLRGAIRALTDGALRSRAIDALMERFQASLEVQGRDARLAQVTGQLSADREDAEAAFTLAAVMVIADDRASELEESLLAETRELLGISARRAGVLLGEVRRAGS